MKRRYILIILCCTFLLPFSVSAATCNKCGDVLVHDRYCINCANAKNKCPICGKHGSSSGCLNCTRVGREIARGVRVAHNTNIHRTSNVDIPIRRTVRGLSDINIPKGFWKGLAGLIALIGGAFSWIFERKKEK